MAGGSMRGFRTDCKGRRLRWFGLAAGLTVALAPLPAHADGMIDSGAVTSWINTVSASQAAQPHWMTPLVTVTPRLEQELRWDFYDQQNGAGTQGNSQRLLSDGGPGGPRVEFIPTYDTEVILAAPPTISASGPKGTQTAAGDWPAFLAKYRFISANEQNGNYIVTGFFQMSVPSGNGAGISNNVLVAQPTLAFGKGWGDFDIQSTLSVQVSRSILIIVCPLGLRFAQLFQKRVRSSAISAIRFCGIRLFSTTSGNIFGRQLRSITKFGQTERMQV